MTDPNTRQEYQANVANAMKSTQSANEGHHGVYVKGLVTSHALSPRVFVKEHVSYRGSDGCLEEAEFWSTF
ncbi:hypothetical protein VNO78_02808 [Psophocarpus tetragonolobus]|uniref:Uncharacterized protein n=1 Tax=Psophocarpus tetragonolobus TaxID=3891 RepID=A0AAN9XV14_PSOTE